jgi:ABC-type multidrug transport system permease subunit
MRRFLLILTNEFKFARTAIPVHIVAIIQPTIMYLLMAAILVDPTFLMNVRPTDHQIDKDLVQALQGVGSPIGKPYVEVQLVDSINNGGIRQVVTIEERFGQNTAVQYFGLIDSNIVKNYRNRLTVAALNLWNAELGEKTVDVEEHPWLWRDVSYKVYFGMALLPLAAAIAASMIGAILTAQEFERGTILQYRLSPVSPALILGARLSRLVLTGLIGVAILLVAVGLITGFWPATLWKVIMVILPIGVIAGSIGVVAGFILRKTIPAFMVALITSFIAWIIGNSFGLAAGFGGGYALASRFSPNSYAVELLFPIYFNAAVGRPGVSILILTLMSLAMISITMSVYRRRVIEQE